MSDDEIVWAAPPEHAHFSGASAPGRYMKFASMLKENPRTWAVLPSQAATVAGAKNTAANIRTGKIKGFVKGQFETAVDDTTIYVRYIGPEEEEGQEEGPEEPELEENGNGTASAVREWALAQGISVPERGRLPFSLWDAYRQANPGS